MKKSLSIILCVLMVVLTFSSCKFIKTKEPAETGDTTASVKSSEESESSASEKSSETKSEKGKEDGESITVFVTDKNNDIVTNKDGTPKTEKIDLNKLQKELEKEMTKSASTKKAGENGKTTKKSSDTSGEIAPQSAKEDLLPEGSKASDTTLMKTTVEPILKGGTYTIKGNIKAEGQSIGAQIAFRNKKDYSVQVTMSVFSVRVFCNNGKYYMALPSMGKYAEVAADDIGDIGDISDSFKDKEAKYVKTTSVKVGKETYTCEEYKTSTGTAKYYFNSKGEWKRMEIIEGETILVWEITSFTKSVENKMFEIDKLWKKDSTLAGIV